MIPLKYDPGARLYQRKCVLAVDGHSFEGLRTTFEITKTLKKEPNTAKIEVYNLAETSRARLQKSGSQIILEAGYGQDYAIVFSGDARTVDHVRTGADWVTKIQCGDGERAYAFTRCSESWGPGVKPVDVAMYLIRKLNLKSGDSEARIRKSASNTITNYLNGYVVHGSASEALHTLLKSLGLRYSIQDGAIQVLGPREATERVVYLSSNTGLIGSPEHGTPDKKGGPSILKVKSLLQSRLAPGARVRLDANKIKGDFRIETTHHKGDTHGGDWYSEIECLAIST